MEKWSELIFGERFSRRFLVVMMSIITGGILAIVVREVIRRW